MSFSELLFTFQPFPRPRFRMIVCPIIPFALPRDRILTRPIAHTFAQSIARMLATLVFPHFSFSANLINTRASRASRVQIPPARSRAALDYVVYQNVVLIRRKVHVLQFLEGGNRFRVCRVKSGIMAKNPKVNINVFSSLLIFGMV